MTKSNYICIGKILRAHGVRGLVKLISYVDEFPSHCYIEESDEPIAIQLLNKIARIWVAKIENVDSRKAAETYRNLMLYKPKEDLTNSGEYYLSDLIDFEVIDENSENIGYIKNIYNFGAGDILEIQPNNHKHPLMLSLDKKFIKSVNLEERKIYIITPIIV